jgi:hypothetical protein
MDRLASDSLNSLRRGFEDSATATWDVDLLARALRPLLLKKSDLSE